MRSFILILLAALLSGCAAARDDGSASGRIILWHDDDPATTTAIMSLTERFMEINPAIYVSPVAVATESMFDQYTDAAELSLGPDLFIGDTMWIRSLADSELIQPLTAYEPALSQYLSASVENVTLNSEVYGIPFSLSPVALYYNADLVETPPATLSDLLEQAGAGQGTAMTTDFARSFWGVSAFGGQVFGADDGRVTLDRGGFASWLTWLNSAQNTAGMFLNNDRATLIDLFASERVAYFVGVPEDLHDLQAAMGEGANIRVATLPAGPGGAAGPLLHVNAFMFNAASAPRNTRAALALARFLTNDENSLRLAREIDHVPANARVGGIDARTYPIVNSFMTQARSAIPIPNTSAMLSILSSGGRLYRQVLDGTLEPTTAAVEFTSSINTALGFEGSVEVANRCTESGELVVWHSWQDTEQAALDTVIEQFETFCRSAEVTTTKFNTESELAGSFRALYASNIGPDVILMSDEYVFELVSESLVQPVPGDAVQQFAPQSINALTYQNAIYGTPIALDLTVLYYNRDRVVDLPRTLDDLLSEAADGRGTAVDTDFQSAFWGVTAFGGGLFDAEMMPTLNRDNAMVNWLDWLLAAAALPGMQIDAADGREAFISGEATYYIGSSSHMASIVEAMDADTVGLAELPAGPVSEATPILRTEALMVNAALPEAELPLVEVFITYATNAENQARLYNDAQLIPANNNFEIEPDSDLVAVRAQVARSTVLPNLPEIDSLLLVGNQLYRDVLSGDAEPAAAVADFIAMFDTQAESTAEAANEG